MDYIIHPVKMGGLVKTVLHDRVKIHLYGRLGVIVANRNMILGELPLEPGHEMEFYFSYIQIVDRALPYDCAEITSARQPEPCLVGGTLTEVNDTAVEVKMVHGLGTIRVPRRWVFTSVPLCEGQNAEFYISCMKVIKKRDIAVESI